jgi:hypothetical protein
MVPRLRQIQSLPSKDGGTSTSNPADILFREEMNWNAWYKLARPILPALTSSERPSQSAIRLPSGRSYVETMPAELLAMVLNDGALDKSDIICFGMASEPLWQHTLQHIRKERRPVPAAPWAGVELACTSTYLIDLPGPFTDNDLARSSVQSHHCPPMVLARQINWAAMRDYDVPSEDPEIAWNLAFEAHRGVAGHISEAQFTKFGDNLRSVSRTFCNNYRNGIWILRNLSTREYVRCRPQAYLGGTRGYVDHPDGKWLCIDDVLLMRICWTTSTAWDPKDDIIVSRRGQWAGHCFDIVALDREEAFRLVNGKWKDVTKDVIQEAKRVRHKIDWGVRLRLR